MSLLPMLLQSIVEQNKPMPGSHLYYYNSARCPPVQLRNFCSKTTTAILFSVTLNCVLYLGKRSEAQRKPGNKQIKTTQQKLVDDLLTAGEPECGQEKTMFNGDDCGTGELLLWTWVCDQNIL